MGTVKAKAKVTVDATVNITLDRETAGHVWAALGSYRDSAEFPEYVGEHQRAISAVVRALDAEGVN